MSPAFLGRRLKAVGQVGATVLDPEVVSPDPRTARIAAARSTSLTPAPEARVLQLMAEGKTNSRHRRGAVHLRRLRREAHRVDLHQVRTWPPRRERERRVAGGAALSRILTGWKEL